jgi:integrase
MMAAMGKMPTPYPRHRKLWFTYRDPEGGWRSKSTGCEVGEERQAARYIARFMAALVGVAGAMPTVEIYFDRWIKKRRELGYVSVGDDETRIKLHVLPAIGQLPIDEVKPRHAADIILDLRTKGELAPRTIRKIAGALHTMFVAAKRDELIDTNPIEFDRGVLPKNVDKDPTWRHEAIYTREEIESLLGDARIPFERRALYALKFFTGRHSEAATCTWSQYDTRLEPLGGVMLGKTKSGVPRAVPMHPAGAALLAEWKLSGWAAMMGRHPRPDDLIAPIFRGPRKGKARRPSQAQVDLIADLELIGLRTSAGADRNRRGHDLRRTLITLAQVDGARREIIEAATHGPRGDIMSVYTTIPWPVLCAEFMKLRIRYRSPDGAAVVPLRAVASAPPQGNSLHVPLQAVATGRIRAAKEATPTGFEGVPSPERHRQTGAVTGGDVGLAGSRGEKPVVAHYRSACDLGLAAMRAGAPTMSPPNPASPLVNPGAHGIDTTV